MVQSRSCHAITNRDNSRSRPGAYSPAAPNSLTDLHELVVGILDRLFGRHLAAEHIGHHVRPDVVRGDRTCLGRVRTGP